jgi:ATP-binding cassette, subfamily F, member 3
MSLVQVVDLSKSFGAQTLFAPFSAAIARGDRIALVGDNGVGKSTLLSMLAGRETASSGAIHLAAGATVGYLPQLARLEGDAPLFEAMHKPFRELLEIERTLRRLEQEMAVKSDRETLHRYDDLLHAFERRGGYTIEAKVRSVLAGVGFAPEEFDQPVSLLSGGQEARAALGRVLLEEPDLLLLDEPTNHLDFAALDWLEETLCAFSGALVLVSHDRHLLEAVTNRTWEIAFAGFSAYRGGYAQSRVLREEERRRQRELYEAQEAEIEKHKDFIRRHHAGQKHRQAKDRERKLERIEKDLVERPRDSKTIHLSIPMGAPSGKRILTLENLTVGYKAPLFACDGVTLYRGERVAIIGPNGSGKTTFLKTLVGRVPPLGGVARLGHNVRPVVFTQDQEGLHGTRSVLDAILAHCDLSIGQARGLLGRFLFSGDDVDKPLDALSGGERSRVALALLALLEGNVLLLDEPTNHLDLASQEILEEALLAYEGTILLVSHDRALLEAVATQVWEIGRGGMRVHSRGYREYRRRVREEEASPRASKPTPARSDSARPEPPRAGKPDRYQERKRDEARSALESQIEAAEGKLRDLESQIEEASARGEAERIAALGTAHEELKASLQEHYAAWDRLTEPDDAA